jgi:hypothetical protein
MIAALLEIYSDSLLNMSGNQIKDWIRDVATCQDYWYQRLEYPQVESESKYISWTEFVNGWIHAAAGKFLEILLFAFG